MKHIIPGSQNLFITDENDILDNKNNVLFKGLDPVSIDINGTSYLKTRTWWYRAVWHNCLTPYDFENLEFSDIDNKLIKPKWVQYYKNPIESHDGFRIIPGFPEYAVDREGNIINVLTGLAVMHSFVKNKDDYHFVLLRCGHSSERKSRIYRVHRIMGITWIPNTDWFHKTIINHIDGVKGNNNVSNLEWVTYKENSLHAVKTGLVKESVKGYIRDIFTGEIKEFPSLESMNEFLNLRAKQIVDFTTRRRNIVYGGRYEVRIEGDERPWIYTDETVNVEPSRYIITVTEPNRSRKIFNGVRSLIRQYNVWNVQSCKDVVNKLKTMKPELHIEVIDQYNNKPIEVRNIETNEVKTYRSVSDLVKSTGFCKTNVLYGMKYNGRKVIHGKYVVRVQSPDNWPDDLINVVNYPVKLLITNNVTHETFTCTSIKDAARRFNLDRDTVKRMAEGRTKPSDMYTIKKQSAPYIG